MVFIRPSLVKLIHSQICANSLIKLTKTEINTYLFIYRLVAFFHDDIEAKGRYRHATDTTYSIHYCIKYKVIHETVISRFARLWSLCNSSVAMFHENLHFMENGASLSNAARQGYVPFDKNHISKLNIE